MQQLDVKVETKTEDNVFVHVIVAVQYHVLEDKVYEAFYRLANANMQITAFVFDVVRARVPRIKLDDLFEKKDEIADAVKNELSHVMYDFGYGIVKALVTDIDPDHTVKEAMNAINAAQRMRVAATEKGEADRILKVKAAEAEAQSKALQGKGIADQRRAIVDGLRESVDEFQKSIPGTSAQDVMNLVLMTQYFDTLKEIGASSETNTILIPHSPGNLSDLTAQMRTAMITADLATRGPSITTTTTKPPSPGNERCLFNSSGAARPACPSRPTGSRRRRLRRCRRPSATAGRCGSAIARSRWPSCSGSKGRSTTVTSCSKATSARSASSAGG